MAAFDLFRDLLGIRSVPVPGAVNVDCICTHNCALSFAGHCRRLHDTAHQAVVDDRDFWLANGFKVPALELQLGPDRRGLPRYRLRAPTRSRRPA